MAAAIRCVERHGIDRTSVALTATEAGVSRPTLYAYFENRDQIVNQAVMAASDSFVERVVAHARRFDTAADRLVEAMVFSVRGIRAEPALALRFGAGQLLHGPLTLDELHYAKVCLEPVVELAPELAGWLDGAAELAARLTISLLTRQPLEPRSEDEERAFLRQWWPRALGLADDEPGDGRAPLTRAASSLP
jgi:AcrR family transcriptional regulator